MATVTKTLPKIKATIGHIPQRLKTQGFENPQGRLEILRRMVTRVFREERCEFKYNRAEECRPYVERIIQLGVHRGRDDEYTMEMLKWWFIQPKLVEKLFNDIVPRLKDTQEPYSQLIRLPTERTLTYIDKRIQKWFPVEIGVLEINGNRFPSIMPLEERRIELLQEYIEKQAGA